jgi:hypothetical protein
MLDFTSLMTYFSSEQYCVVKLNSTFPDYKIGEDLDIYSFFPEKLIQIILEWGDDYVKKQGYVIQVQNRPSKHFHVDFVLQDELQFRFDLYGELPLYKNLSIKPSLFESVIENCILSKRKECKIKTPCTIDNALLRYIEFTEWYQTKPDKIKHLDYIFNKVSVKNQKRLLDKLHYYTQIPNIYEDSVPAYRPSSLRLFIQRFNKDFFKALLRILLKKPYKIPFLLFRYIKRQKSH